MSTVLPLVEAASQWPARGALIGLDLGTKTIGVAACDPDRKLAAGVTTITRKNFTADAKALLALARERANRPAPSRAISASSPSCRSHCGTSGSPRLPWSAS
jgi:hypothetical protein